MRDTTSGGGAAALLAIALVLMLIVGGAAFYLMSQRHQQALAVAIAREHVAEAQAELTRERATVARALPAQEQPLVEAKGLRAAIEGVLRAQQEAWNEGDVDAFVEHYWKSDDVTFSSGGKTTRGWDEMARGYRERYPTREAMGQLEFGDLEITPLGAEAALVLGSWRLERESEPVAGNFSLVFQKIEGRWVIAHDHTSQTAE